MKTNQGRQATQQEAPHAPQKRPSAKKSANMAPAWPNRNQLMACAGPPLKHVRTACNAVYKTYWFDTPGHRERRGGFFTLRASRRGGDELRTSVYPSNFAPIATKLRQRAFQTICKFRFFDAEQKIFAQKTWILFSVFTIFGRFSRS